MQQSPLDLFGEVPVTTHDIDAWLRAIPRIEPGTRRAAQYVEDWAVVDKIRAAKLRGDFHQLTAQPEGPSPFWWTRFSWAR